MVKRYRTDATCASHGQEDPDGRWVFWADAEARIRELEDEVDAAKAKACGWNDRCRELEAANAILAAEVNRLNIAMCAAQSDRGDKP